MSEMIVASHPLPAAQEATAILNAANEGASFDKLLKFKKGQYFVDKDTEVKLRPFEDKAGEIVIFVTASVGGTRAVHDLCKAYGRRVARTGVSEQPLIKILSTPMPTKRGPIPRPLFEIIGWDSAKEGIRSFSGPDSTEDELADEIPY